VSDTISAQNLNQVLSQNVNQVLAKTRINFWSDSLYKNPTVLYPKNVTVFNAKSAGFYYANQRALTSSCCQSALEL